MVQVHVEDDGAAVLAGSHRRDLGDALSLADLGGAVKAAVRDWASEGSHRLIEWIEERAVGLVDELVEGLA